MTDESRSRSLLGYAPRPVLDLALARPEAYLGGDPLGLCAEQQDISIAYQLLTEVPSPPPSCTERWLTEVGCF